MSGMAAPLLGLEMQSVKGMMEGEHGLVWILSTFHMSHPWH